MDFMQSSAQGQTYRIWDGEHSVQDPMELPALVESAQAGRVTPCTWVFVEGEGTWRTAEELPELGMFFNLPSASSSSVQAEGTPGILKGLKPGALRRVKILAHLTDAQLAVLLNFVEVQEAPQWSTVVKQGDHGDAMFLVLSGELRVRLMISGKESILATLGTGDFFGEVSLIDAGPRSADVVANQTSILLKISAAAFDRLLRESPAVAASLLLATARTLTARIRADNKRYSDSVAFFRAAR
jgi:hypothetical protein